MTRNRDDILRQARFLREQAERCRRLANATTDAGVSRRLLQLAGEFEEQALGMEDENRG